MASKEASDRILKALQKEIVLGQLRPGTRLRESAVAERFRVSRTPVREAFHVLRGEGLLEYQKNVGYRVVEFTVQDVVDIFEVRSLLEGHAARILASRSDGRVVSKLKDMAIAADEAQEHYHRNPKTRDHMNRVRMDHRFHQCIIDASGNKLLARLSRNTSFQRIGILAIDAVPGKAGKKRPLHCDIVRAISEGAPARAERAAKDHLGDYRHLTLEQLIRPTSNLSW